MTNDTISRKPRRKVVKEIEEVEKAEEAKDLSIMRHSLSLNIMRQAFGELDGKIPRTGSLEEEFPLEQRKGNLSWQLLGLLLKKTEKRDRIDLPAIGNMLRKRIGRKSLSVSLRYSKRGKVAGIYVFMEGAK